MNSASLASTRLVLILLSTACLIHMVSGVAPARDNMRQSFLSGECPNLVDLIKKVAPVVVNISIEKHILQNSSAEPPPLFRPGHRWPQERSGNKDGALLDSLGSGFFYDDQGHIITNAHVVEGAAKIQVTLSSGKVATAKVVAVHPKVDLALLKIDPPHPLKKAQVGDSSSVQVGEWVLAVGNPFGLGRTVTFGIVSGMGRFIGLGPDDDFIQTDADINPGNSGGPLFNMYGEVVGVNTAIIASGRGIGFSIPSNYVKDLIKAPRNMRRARRGWLGVYVEDMTKEKAREMGLAEPRGTFVDEVLRPSPAFNAGLKKGDLILDAGGEAMRNGRQLSRVVAACREGKLLKMTVLRRGKTIGIDVVIGKAPD
ncbi:S1C family serine protease [Thermodesulfobacteriota bacterium]